MIYLITGCTGFIGFNLSNNLLKNEKNKVYGIDLIYKFLSKFKVSLISLEILEFKINPLLCILSLLTWYDN